MTVDPANLAVPLPPFTGEADLTWDPSTDPGLLDYSVFRRTPSTGAAFVPGVDTPLATGIVTESYSDTGLVTATYDWQVFGRTWRPTDLASLVAWYDATQGVTNAGGGAVSQWNDLSGNARHLAQANGAARPTTGVDTQNGLNVLKFSGGQSLVNSAIAVAAANTVTCYMVVKPTATGSYERALSLDSGGNDFDNAASIAAILRDASSGNWGSYYNGGMRAEKAMSNAAHVIVTQRNGDSHRVWVDGVASSAVTGLGTTNFGYTRLWIGGDNTASFLTGDVAESFMSRAADSAPTIATASAYLKAKWATP